MISWTKTDALILTLLTLMGACIFLTGITWGLPSHAADHYLFGDHPIWTGKQILEFAPQPPPDDNRGADVDANPITDRTHPILLNETDAQRAEIVRRYRLFSYQPDEMITFKSLAGMHPARADLDPHLYQYGGLWIYPVGALLKLSSLFHLITLHPDPAFYLDNPEQFARFYIVARAYSTAWGLLGISIIYYITRHLTATRLGAATAAFCYAWMPAVINAAHEAKPHLAGAILMLLTAGAAARYVTTGRRRCAIAAGGFAGASLGMILSGLWAFALLPLMIFLRPPPNRLRHFIFAISAGIGVYVLSNPYVPYNAFFHPARLTSNLHNSTAMYAVHSTGSAFLNALTLISEGTSLPLAILGAIGLLILLILRMLKKESPKNPLALFLFVLSAIVLLQFILLASGKPGEYGRFALLPDITIAIAAVITLTHFRWEIGPILRSLLLIALALSVIPFGIEYIYAFYRDTSLVTSRLEAAFELDSFPGAIGLKDEPAPYLMPPVNLFERNLVLLPTTLPPGIQVDFTLQPLDDPTQIPRNSLLVPTHWNSGTLWRPATRLSWANKRFQLIPLRGFLSTLPPTQTTLAASNPP
ncbi:MAG TPA: hypothetical protein VFE58_05265 [Tepidisphaeraceae bacterium]|jgi:hypothetical protein|nr:hypothetical protein [Tepidisphaeraceae bacterium]